MHDGHRDKQTVNSSNAMIETSAITQTFKHTLVCVVYVWTVELFIPATRPGCALRSKTRKMGRKKPFIDKSKATTYHVMYKEHDDAEDPFEFVSAADMQQRVEEAAEANSARHPLAFLYEDEDDHVQTEEQRQEILGMGLPDDGYNYLKHMRAPGARTQMMIVPNATGESSTDVNPEEQKGTDVWRCSSRTLK